ncbi:MAG: DUF2680 domain-containing protein [Chloroflexi bacterium]|nr:DUF2680 domain-containing protein [Chloroflexota bacterium]
MKKSLVLIATIAAVILIGNVVVAYAQNGVTPAQPNAGVCPGGYTCPYTGTMPYGGMRGGMMGGNMGAMYNSMMADGGMHEAVLTAIAAELDLTYDELTTALQTQTLAQIAEAQGVSLETLQQVATTARNAELDELVAAGTLTQEQADWMKSRMQAMPNFGTGDCPMQNGQSGAQPGAYGRGMMGGRGGPGGMMGGRGYAQPTGPQG